MFRSLLIWLTLSSGIAFFWPVQSVGFDPFVASSWGLWTLIVATMFSLGTLIRVEELRPLREKPWWVGLGVVVQVIVMPAAAWLVTQLVPMSEELAAGVILVGCVPGAMASNVLTNTAGGSVAFSVSLTTIATLLSPVTVPTVLWIVTGLESDKSLTEPAFLLATLVVLPTVLGFFVSRQSNRVREFLQRWSPVVASVALLWIIASVVASNREKLMNVSGILIVALLLINLLGYLAGYGAGRAARLPSPFVRALTLEVGMQNAGLGTALAVSLYGPNTMATIPTAAYTFGCMFTGAILAVAWKRSQQAIMPLEEI